MDGLERQMQKHLLSELSNPNLASRTHAATRLRMVLLRPEFSFGPEVSEALEAQLKLAHESADASVLVNAISTAVRAAGWKAMQRLMFYQLIAPHPNVNVNVGSSAAPPQLQPQVLPQKPPPADRPDYLRLVTESAPGEAADQVGQAQDAPSSPAEDGEEPV